MKILIAAASFASSISGIQRHAFNLARCLLGRDEISELHLVVAPWQRRLLNVAQLPVDSRLLIHLAEMNRDSISRNIWYFRHLPLAAARLEVDLVHLSYPMPLDSTAFKCPTALTLHDMYPYEIPMNFGFPKFLFNRVVLRQCLRAVDGVACVSETSREQLKRFAPVSVWRKSIHIPNCVEPNLSVASEPAIQDWNGDPFLLCIAQHRKNKNIPTLIQAFKHLLHSNRIPGHTKLVVVGIDGPETRGIYRMIRDDGLGDSICLLEGLTESELQWCYSHCDALVAPSLTEGFGLPVAEGIMAGCRIVCSDIPAHREVADDHCKFVLLGTATAADLALPIAEVLREPKPNPASLPRFSAPVLAKQYIAFYRRLIAAAENKAKAETSGSASLAAS